MKTLESTARFMRAWCQSRDIELISSEKVTVPHAVYDRKNNRKMIYMPLLSSLNFDEWQRVGYHEAAHLAPQNIWHYDVFNILKRRKGAMLHDIANCLVDNLAERVDFHEYRGRAEILSSARAALSPRLGEVMRTDKDNPMHSLRVALLKWDMLNREGWMMDYVSPPAHEEIPHLEALYQRTQDIKLDYIIDRIAASDDIAANTNELVALCLEIDSWITTPPQPEGGQGQGGSGNQDDNGHASEQGTEENSGEAEQEQAGGSAGDEGASEAASEGEDGLEGGAGGAEAGDGEDEGTESSSGAGESAEQGDKGGAQQQSGASDSGTDSESPPERTGEAPTGGQSQGSNFNPEDEGAELTDVKYTQEELDAMQQYTEDLERDIGESVFASQREAYDAMYRKGRGKRYIPCSEQRVVRISEGSHYREEQKRDILRRLGMSTLDKQVRKHLQLRSTGRTVHGVKRGRLSGKNLHRLYNNGGNKVQPAVFKRREHGKVKMDSAVTLLVDLSGSMGNSPTSEKYNLAAASAISFTEVLNGLRIKHEIMGFTHSPGTHTIYMFKEFPEKPLTSDVLASRFASSRIYKDHNADGESVQFAAERLMQMNEKNKVLMVLSDGQPNGYWTGDGKHYLKEVVKDVEQHSPIHLCAIGIKSERVEHYYSNYEIVHDIEELAAAVIGTLKTNLLTF